MRDVTFKPYSVDDHEWLVDQHQRLYSKYDGFDETFGPLVDEILTDFEQNSDPKAEKGWIAYRCGQRLGSIFCVRIDDTTAKLRLFLLVPEARGQGLGRKLLAQCMTFAQSCGYQKMSLWTHESHLAACALYRKNDWRCISSKSVMSFGQDLVEQQWEFAF